mmetsp:Transcript_13748/g.22067  ORF Transcript_13748/g.22067 Transcript_13748/m.22067 type:complete len:208 (+) Transcript_13748:545-1168(+)
MRVGALQDCPEFCMQWITPRLTAFSSASAKMMLAPLPPSSRLTRFNVSAAALEMAMPARVEPVKDTMSTSGWADSCEPTPTPSPLTMLKTPAGKPASSIISVKTMEDRGAISDGFNTIVQPTRSAGMAFRKTWFIGQFQGVIIAQTPIGSLRMRSAPMAYSNSNFSRASRNPSRCQTPAPHWLLLARSVGAPISMRMASAMSSRRVM